MRSGSDEETAIVDGGVFERVPECCRAGWVCEANGSVLVRDDLTADAGQFGDQLTLRDSRVAVAQ